MFPDYNINSTPLLLLSIQGLIFTILLLRRYFIDKNTPDLLLAFILLITCYHQTNYTIGFMGWYDTFRNTKINYYLVSLSLALAPLIYFYFRSVVKPKNTFLSKDFYHFIPCTIYITIRAFILIYDASQVGFEDGQNGVLVVNFQWKYLDPIVTLLEILQMLVYLVLSFQLLYSYREKIKHFFSNTFKLELNWLNNFLILYTFLYLYNSTQIVVNAMIVDLSWKQEWWYYLLSGLVIVYVGIKGYYTDLSELKGVEIQSFLEKDDKILVKNLEKYNAESELSTKVISLKIEIEEYFKKHKPYLKSDLTLVSLAKKLNVSREDLSEAINKGFNLKFNDFINYYRIEEFKLRTSQGHHKELSLLGVAYESGFNSKATFNRAFKKVVKISPSEYLKTIK